jgi:hypothetical protein
MDRYIQRHRVKDIEIVIEIEMRIPDESSPGLFDFLVPVVGQGRLDGHQEAVEHQVEHVACAGADVMILNHIFAVIFFAKMRFLLKLMLVFGNI